MTDDDLWARLRRVDPAASLMPIAPDRVSRLLEETMTDATAPPNATAHRATIGRYRFVALAAAALVALAIASGWSLMRPQNTTPAGIAAATPSQPTAVATPSKPTAVATPSRAIPTPQPPSITRLTAAGREQGRCQAPSPQSLATQADFVFAGRVTGISGDVVTLQVTHLYKGATTDVVRVTQEDDTAVELLGGVSFATGEKYLVASFEGGVMGCGYSGVADTPDLQELYERAF
ncbi:hypothetical protein [Micromonospora sp. CB01531]|uniref:hypothetical protein n=1 Tax=Micromonospora sp. CB01531 TaxID=1718947 RepID=UPI00093E1198|nr:hypothetical protein [Micromonospora sp. CB01531]OKI48964.1 hypothetical protein A6A27_36160 [Micromonospora sp. CB01531]